MGKKTTIKLKDLEKVIKEMPKKKIEKECNQWGCVTPHYEEVINPDRIMHFVNKFLKND